jgi:LacI family transcriptional regulator
MAEGRRLLADPRRPSAFLADDDLLASGLVAAARASGLGVPDDVAVVGFDDLDVARLLDITTVRFDPEALGAAAFGLLLARLQGKRPKNVVLPSELVVRGSTAG